MRFFDRSVHPRTRHRLRALSSGLALAAVVACLLVRGRVEGFSILTVLSQGRSQARARFALPVEYAQYIRSNSRTVTTSSIPFAALRSMLDDDDDDDEYVDYSDDFYDEWYSPSPMPDDENEWYSPPPAPASSAPAAVAVASEASSPSPVSHSSSVPPPLSPISTISDTIVELKSRLDLDAFVAPTGTAGDDESVAAILFHASWCRTCHKMIRMYRQKLLHNGNRDNQTGNIRLATMEFGSNRKLCVELGIEKLPTICLYKYGERVAEYAVGPSQFQRVLDGVEYYQKFFEKVQLEGSKGAAVAAAEERELEETLQRGSDMVVEEVVSKMEEDPALKQPREVANLGGNDAFTGPPPEQVTGNSTAVP